MVPLSIIRYLSLWIPAPVSRNFTKYGEWFWLMDKYWNLRMIKILSQTTYFLISYSLLLKNCFRPKRLFLIWTQLTAKSISTRSIQKFVCLGGNWKSELDELEASIIQAYQVCRWDTSYFKAKVQLRKYVRYPTCLHRVAFLWTSILNY